MEAIKVGNIRDLENFTAKLWPWDWLNECFSGGIRPTDVDGMVERNGHFLFLEGKTSGQSIPKGQEIALKKLSLALADKVLILVLFGRPGQPTSFREIKCGLISEPRPCNVSTIQGICRDWFLKANNSWN